MFRAKQYLLAQSLEEAYAANQKRTATVVGGMCWLKMSNRQIQTLIDLSALGLDTITRTDEGFSIGAMVTLRQLETDAVLNETFQNAFADAVRPIVGVQFRNCATIGGSVWGRFGFSDVIAVLLALKAKVELYPTGVVELDDFLQMPYDNQILVRILVPFTAKKAAVQSHRNTATDFPVLVAVASELADGSLRLVAGARPQKAALVNTTLTAQSSAEEIEQQLENGLQQMAFCSNMRGSAEYRRHLAKVLLKRAIAQLKEGTANAD